MNEDLGSGIVSIPIAVMYSAGVLKYEQAKALNARLMVTDAPDSFAELCMICKTTLDKVNENLTPVQGS